MSEVPAPQHRSKFCMIHWSGNHDIEECPEVRATIDKMVENRYKPSSKSETGLPPQPKPINYIHQRGRGRGRRTKGGDYHLAPRISQQTNQRGPNEQTLAIQPIVREINTIIGGPYIGGESNNAQKSYIRAAKKPTLENFWVGREMKSLFPTIFLGS
ncbi:hypothetical protein Adt_04316 [Abeliophyllum distichum]|uniref:Uncharacterized protein n=1 Tax=Abeliophyllum distichum TaxID=126358 RepID=A0ABD1W344_9LAMI